MARIKDMVEEEIFDPYVQNRLGVVRPAFSRAAMLEIVNLGGRDYAKFAVYVCNMDKTQTIIVCDCREETVQAFREAEPACHAFAQAKGKNKTPAIVKARLTAIKHATEVLNTGHARCVVQKADRNTGQRQGLNILLSPIKADDETEGTQTAAIIHSEGRGVVRLPYDKVYKEYTTRYNRTYRGEWQVFDAHLVLGDDEHKAEIYQSNATESMRFLVDSEGVHVFTAKFEAIETATKPPKATKPTVRVKCGACLHDVEVDSVDNDAGEAVCPLCGEPASSTPLEDAEMDLTDAEIEALDGVGINTVEKLAGADPDTLKNAGIGKIARMRKVVKDAKAAIE